MNYVTNLSFKPCFPSEIPFERKSFLARSRRGKHWPIHLSLLRWEQNAHGKTFFLNRKEKISYGEWMNEWMDVGPRLVRIDFDLFSRYLLKQERNEQQIDSKLVGMPANFSLQPGTRMWLARIFERNIRVGEIYANIGFSRDPKVNAISGTFIFGEIYAPKFALKPIRNRSSGSAT